MCLNPLVSRHCFQGTLPELLGRAGWVAVALDPQQGAGAIMQWVVLIAALIASLAGVASALSPEVTDALIEHAAPIMPSCVVLGLAISLCYSTQGLEGAGSGVQPKPDEARDRTSASARRALRSNTAIMKGLPTIVEA